VFATEGCINFYEKKLIQGFLGFQNPHKNTQGFWNFARFSDLQKDVFFFHFERDIANFAREFCVF
jgi:hypothetical protein